MTNKNLISRILAEFILFAFAIKKMKTFFNFFDETFFFNKISSFFGAKTHSIMTFSIVTFSIIDIQHNDIQHNGIQHNDIQHTDIQQNDPQSTHRMRILPWNGGKLAQ